MTQVQRGRCWDTWSACIETNYNTDMWIWIWFSHLTHGWESIKSVSCTKLLVGLWVLAAFLIVTLHLKAPTLGLFLYLTSHLYPPAWLAAQEQRVESHLKILSYFDSVLDTVETGRFSYTKMLNSEVFFKKNQNGKEKGFMAFEAETFYNDYWKQWNEKENSIRIMKQYQLHNKIYYFQCFD